MSESANFAFSGQEPWERLLVSAKNTTLRCLSTEHKLFSGILMASAFAVNLTISPPLASLLLLIYPVLVDYLSWFLRVINIFVTCFSTPGRPLFPPISIEAPIRTTYINKLPTMGMNKFNVWGVLGLRSKRL